MTENKSRTATAQERIELVAYFERQERGLEWLARAARHFAECDLPYPMDHAKALIEHPRMQDTDYNRRNGYLPYTTPSELFDRICRVHS